MIPAISLSDLRGLRSAPPLSEPQRLQLIRELEQAIAPFSWFTLGVMAPDAETAISVLRRVETALGWPALQPAGNAPAARSDTVTTPTEAAPLTPQALEEGLEQPPLPPETAFSGLGDAPVANSAPPSLPVFLKGNQRTGLYQLRPEAGLGVGLLITGQEAATAIASETWGPLPLDLFG
ncbi:MAG: DUF1824 family protein [Synechococcaceae cyanobacterium]|nr:DUF1824 family protein [Synechococcaceae cyanobacterium]